MDKTERRSLYEIVKDLHSGDKFNLEPFGESRKGPSTRVHFQRLGQIARNAYAEKPSKVAGVVSAVRDILEYDALITGFRVSNAADRIYNAADRIDKKLLYQK